MTIDAQKLREKAQKLVAKQNFQSAVELYVSALDKQKGTPDLWCELGSLQKTVGDSEGCGSSYFKAAEIYLENGEERYALAACQKAVQSGGKGVAVDSARDMLKVLAGRIKEQKAKQAGAMGLPQGAQVKSLLHLAASSGRVQLGEVRRLVANDYHEIDTTPLPPPLSALRPIRRRQRADFEPEPTTELDMSDLVEATNVSGLVPRGLAQSGEAPPPPPVSYWDEAEGGAKPKPKPKPKEKRPTQTTHSAPGVAAPKEHFMVLSRRDAGSLLSGLRYGLSYGISEIELEQIVLHSSGAEDRIAQILGRSPLFEGLTPAQLAQHAPKERIKKFAPGDIIASSGSGADLLLSLISGTASAVTFTPPITELALLRPGAIVGEQSFTGTAGMKTRVIARDQVEAVALTRPQAEELLSDHPASLYTMLRIVEERVVDNMLQRAGFFRLFTPEERDQICPRFEILEVADDEVIVEQGTPSKTLCLLMSGIIELSHTNTEGRSVRMLLDPGGVFGEESLIDGRPQVFTARTTARSWIMLLRREDYLQIYERHPALVRSLKDVLRRRRRMLEQVNGGEVDLTAARWPDFDPSSFTEKQTKPTVDRGTRKS